MSEETVETAGPATDEADDEAAAGDRSGIRHLPLLLLLHSGGMAICRCSPVGRSRTIEGMTFWQAKMTRHGYENPCALSLAAISREDSQPRTRMVAT